MASVKPLKNSNPLWKAIVACCVSPMKLWASDNGDLVTEKAGAAAKDIGASFHATAQLWHGLSPEERKKWETLADKHSKDKEDQITAFLLSAMEAGRLAYVHSYGKQHSGPRMVSFSSRSKLYVAAVPENTEVNTGINDDLQPGTNISTSTSANTSINHEFEPIVDVSMGMDTSHTLQPGTNINVNHNFYPGTVNSFQPCVNFGVNASIFHDFQPSMNVSTRYNFQPSTINSFQLNSVNSGMDHHF